MERSTHFSWENSRFQWWFSIVFCMFTRGYLSDDDPFWESRSNPTAGSPPWLIRSSACARPQRKVTIVGRKLGIFQGFPEKPLNNWEKTTTIPEVSAYSCCVLVRGLLALVRMSNCLTKYISNETSINRRRQHTAISAVIDSYPIISPWTDIIVIIVKIY